MAINWIGWILSFVILLLLFLTGYLLQNSVHLLIAGKRAHGIVVGMESSSRFNSEPGRAPMFSPMVEFVTSDGELIRVSGRSYTSAPSARVGDDLTVAYSKSNPRNALLLTWEDFPIGPASVLLGFVVVLILMWMGGILISNDPTLDDPFHLLPTVIAHFHLNPVRFPVLLILFFAIPSCVLGTYWTYNITADLRSNGMKVTGYVTAIERGYSKSNNGTIESGMFPMIDFEDSSGTPHTIRRSLAKPLSRLKAGDKVEVIYLAGKPDQGRVNTWDEFWPSPIFFGFSTFALLVLFILVINGYKSIVPETHDPGIHKELKTSGVSAIATVIKANKKTRYLHYRIKEDAKGAAAKLENFVSLEGEFSFWVPRQTEAEIKEGDRFRAYLDSLKPVQKFYIDFNDKIGNDPFVRSMDDEDASIEEERMQ
ncbi:MAG: DUF3592 domain-containing protein [Ignavibacteriae bacterium]|nr:MAG: DUF3592 domain-containing protein [Ignavibacteriota bacterium]